MTEKEKMISGKLYHFSDEELVKLSTKCKNLCLEYNSLSFDNESRKKEILKLLMPNSSSDIVIHAPIYFDYGCFTKMGYGCFANFNLTILDVCPVTIGKNVYFGPNVSIYTALHPLIAKERIPYIDDNGVFTDIEYGKPVTIGDNCWIAGSVIIFPGVNIGANSVIGAGSLVTNDIPENVLAYGSPCKVIRQIDEKESVYLKKELL